MAVNIDRIAEKTMKIIQGLGLQTKMFDSSQGKSVADPQKARYFFVEMPNLMVFIDEESHDLNVDLGERTDLDNPQVKKLVDMLKDTARSNLLDFNTKSFGKHIEPKNYAFKIEQNKEQAMSDVFNEGISPLEGSSRTSRQTLENARIIVKHRNPVNEESRGSRSRNISAIFIENADGERFKYPFKHLNGARAMARHVANGGVPSDMVGEAIVEHSSNLSKLKEFMNVVNKQGLVNENNRSIVANVKQKMDSIKESIKRIQGTKGYTAFVESMALNENSDDVEISEDTVNDYVSKFTKTTFEESLKDILPLVHRVNEEEMENNRANQVARVKEIILATDKKTGEKKNKISFPGRSDGYNFDKIKNQYAKPTNAADAAQQKIMAMALQFDDIADRVDVDTTDDKKRKNKGHDRAAELSNFLHDFANDMRENPKNLNKEKVALAGHLLKLSKTQTEEVHEAKTVEEKFDNMLAEAFSKFDILD
jgi:hypothetical protein